jgi:hypothetical protein
MGNYIVAGINYIDENYYRVWLNDRLMKQFGNDLINKGHTCVIISKTYPAQVCWCGNDECMGI